MQDKPKSKTRYEKDHTPYPMPNMPEKAKKRFRYYYDLKLERQQAKERKGG